MKNKTLLWIFVLLFACLMSIPWLVPHTGALVLVGFLPLLMADDFASQLGIKGFWRYYFVAFLLWNAATTFWVCNATVGGGIAAIVLNALQMSVIFALFRASKRRFSGVVPYIFLAVAWIAWEKFYLEWAEISWPWLVLGNAFARSTRIVQWYEYTGTLGGSLWVWVVNLGIYGLVVSLADGLWSGWKPVGRILAAFGITLLLAGPVVFSEYRYMTYDGESGGTLDVVIGQPDFDPYEKFGSMSQEEQNKVLLNLYDSVLDEGDSTALLLLAPETFTSDIVLGRTDESPTVRTFRDYLKKYPKAEILFGASTYDFSTSHSAPSILARQLGDTRWVRSHNSALIADASGRTEVFHKSKLVVGTELTPYPRFFVKLDDWLCRTFDLRGPLMGRCEGQDGITLLHFGGELPLGCAVCYESVYPEYCAGYVRKGAQAMTVITNDAWWGDTPGYRQHLSYSCLRAIELRRDIARCANTGISCFIDRRGDILDSSPWWESCVMLGTLRLSSEETAFVRYGDICGRVCVFAFLLLLALLLVRLIVPGNKLR